MCFRPEIITLTTAISSPIIGVLSSSIADFPSAANEFTTERICRFLKTDRDNYKVVKNVKSNLNSVCWKIFGFPAQKNLLKKKNLNQIQALLVMNLVFKRMHLHVFLVHEYLMHIFVISWNGIPFKILSFRPMGYFEEFPSHGKIFYVPSHSTWSPDRYRICFEGYNL